jgi:hypothetical protein
MTVPTFWELRTQNLWEWAIANGSGVLPGEDGFALARWLREKSGRINIIMVLTMDGLLGLGRCHQKNGFLAKGSKQICLG